MNKDAIKTFQKALLENTDRANTGAQFERDDNEATGYKVCATGLALQIFSTGHVTLEKSSVPTWELDNPTREDSAWDVDNMWLPPSVLKKLGITYHHAHDIVVANDNIVHSRLKTAHPDIFEPTNPFERVNKLLSLWLEQEQGPTTDE